MEDLSSFLSPAYDWIKVIHILAVISWMAGLLYLPRLFVYHASVPAGSERSELFKVMEYRLFRFIMGPAMHVAWFAGLLLAIILEAWEDGGWFHAKLTAVVLMTVFHAYCGRLVKAFKADKNVKSEKFFRISNEVPTLLMVLIVILVVVKPF
ncbi:protoporphyrinogen oxidase HemJ [Kiloniella sp. b19]|uniref:protoporphyrinogen oxidase HemJ n=1 Tax=Kiloniella sp. GXU_MW_B19 TaxID=3141326 RepID=UPI0031D6BB8B